MLHTKTKFPLLFLPLDFLVTRIRVTFNQPGSFSWQSQILSLSLEQNEARRTFHVGHLPNQGGGPSNNKGGGKRRDFRTEENRRRGNGQHGRRDTEEEPILVDKFKYNGHGPPRSDNDSNLWQQKLRGVRM